MTLGWRLIKMNLNMSESKDFELLESGKKISRRKFVSGAIATGVVAYLGIRESSSSEGKPSQRARQLVEIAKLIKKEPQNEEYKNLLVAWLKFAVVAEFGRLKGYRLAVATTEHFLDGQGETLDITDLLRNSVRAFNQRKNENVDQALARSFGEAIAKRGRELYIEKKPLPPSLDLLRSLADQPDLSQEVYLSLMTGPRSINEDVYHSLNVFTLNIKGKAEAEINKGVKPGEPSKLKATIKNPDIVIEDEYDWIKGSPSETGIYLGQEIDNFLYRLFKNEKPSQALWKILGEKTQQRLSEVRGLTITDAEGEILMRYGFGKKFKVKAKFAFKTPLSFQVPLSA